MLETNIRIVRPGPHLYLWVRTLQVVGTDLSPELLERACGSLRHRHGIAAILAPDKPATLLVAAKNRVPAIRLEEREWALDVTDTEKEAQRLTLADPVESEIMADLILRALQTKLARNSNFWTLDSTNIWYEPMSFANAEGIAAYRRYEIGTIPIDGVGIGIIADAETAFFSDDTLAYFFDLHISEDEQSRRQAKFDQLTSRQAGQKGTLWYNNGRYQLKCYFEAAPRGITCSTTGEIRWDGSSYSSLTDYYAKELPELQFDPNGRAVRVSFDGKPRSVWVAAERLRIRVMNEFLPGKLRNVDKIAPQQRHDLLQTFWKQLEPDPLGKLPLGFQTGFWRPKEDRIHQFPLAGLTFGQNQILQAPETSTVGAYRKNYQQRLELLDEAGCYFAPATMPRILHLAYPAHLDKEVATRLATELAEIIQRKTKRPVVAADLVAYDTVSSAIKVLESRNAELLVFILNDEPGAYHEVAFRRPWRVKRITEREFQEHAQDLKRGAWNRKFRSNDPVLGRRRWDSFVTMNVLGILQLLDVYPFRLTQAGKYEAQLTIDVGHDRRYFALSLVIARKDGTPDFRVYTEVEVKPDPQHETINARLLKDHIIGLFKKVLGAQFDPLRSLLALYDGEIHTGEAEAIIEGARVLGEQGMLTSDACVHLAELRKTMRATIRLWEVHDTMRVDNPLEGTAVLLNPKALVVTSTGAATLHQGTASPLLFTVNGYCPEILEVGRAGFAAAQLNYSSPEVAQRLPLGSKRTDEELIARAAQEIKRLK